MLRHEDDWTQDGCCGCCNSSGTRSQCETITWNDTQMRALPITLSKMFIRHNAVTTGDEAPTRIRAYGGNVSMRFILRCLMAASCILVFLGSAQAQSLTIGETAVLSGFDGGNGNLLAAQSATLAKAATIQSLS